MFPIRRADPSGISSRNLHQMKSPYIYHQNLVDDDQTLGVEVVVTAHEEEKGGSGDHHDDGPAQQKNEKNGSTSPGFEFDNKYEYPDQMFDIESRSKVTCNTAYRSSFTSSVSSLLPAGSEDGEKPRRNNKRIHDRHLVAADPSVILSLERTLFAALNNAWLLAVGGIGLMSVGHGDYRATHGGIAILVGGIVTALMAYGMHISRVLQLKRNKSFRYYHSVIWASSIACLTIMALLLELHFGIMYPYLQREKTVTIANSNSMNTR